MGYRNYWRAGTTPKKKKETPEDDAQKEIVKLLRDLRRFGLLLFFAVPNQLQRSKALRLIFHALGCESGVPDLVILLRGARTVFIELKAGRQTKADKRSDSQRDFQAALVDFGFQVETIYCESPIDGRKKTADFLRRLGLAIS